MNHDRAHCPPGRCAVHFKCKEPADQCSFNIRCKDELHKQYWSSRTPPPKAAVPHSGKGRPKSAAASEMEKPDIALVCHRCGVEVAKRGTTYLVPKPKGSSAHVTCDISNQSSWLLRPETKGIKKNRLFCVNGTALVSVFRTETRRPSNWLAVEHR